MKRIPETGIPRIFLRELIPRSPKDSSPSAVQSEASRGLSSSTLDRITLDRPDPKLCYTEKEPFKRDVKQKAYSREEKSLKKAKHVSFAPVTMPKKGCSAFI